MTASSSRPTVLVVEDEPLLRELVVEELVEAGFEVIAAADGHDALTALSDRTALDVLFTDIRLPGSVDGWEIARAARSRHPRIQVVYASGYTVDRSAQVPDSIYLTKPYLPAEVISRIRQQTT